VIDSVALHVLAAPEHGLPVLIGPAPDHVDLAAQQMPQAPLAAQPGVDRSHGIRTVAVTKEAMNGIHRPSAVNDCGDGFRS
jgi:hypothetical protein